MKPGDPILLRLQLGRDLSDKHVKAHVYDMDNVEFAGSPFTLAYQSEGRYEYSDPSLIFPADTFEVEAVYAVFEDAGFTRESPVWARTKDIFRLELAYVDLSQVNNKLDQILADLDYVRAGADMKGYVEEPESIRGVIEENELAGVMIDDEIRGQVEEDEIRGVITDDELVGSWEEDNE